MAKVEVNIKDTDAFKDILEVIKAFIGDERVDKSVIQEYRDSIQEIIDKNI